MTLSSMTGFARRGGELGTYRWNWELKSVNNKGLEIRTKLPSYLDGFDLELKKKISAKITRGSLFLNLFVERTTNSESFVINQDRLEKLSAIAGELISVAGLEPARVDGLLAVKGVVDLVVSEPADDDIKALKIALNKDLDVVLDDLIDARAEEGSRMQAVLMSQLSKMRTLLDSAREQVGDRDSALRKRFETQLAKLSKLGSPIPEERIAQELAIIVVKADIQEEFDRLASHFDEADRLLASNKPVGRRLDFLCQEFNREANTLCSKSGDTKLTQIGVDLKVLIDQFREQVQNIE